MIKNAEIKFCKAFTICLMVGVFSALLSIAPDAWAGKKKTKVSNPSKFKVSYSLKNKSTAARKPKVSGAIGLSGVTSSSRDVDIAVNILDARFFPVKAFSIRKTKKTRRIESLWDGKDVYGKEMPEGVYYASLSIVYSDKTKEVKFFRFVKD